MDGEVATNGIETFWSLLKRTITGTYVSIEPFHLFRYLDEQAFRFNKRDGNDSTRFVDAVKNVAGKRVTYKALTGGTLEGERLSCRTPEATPVERGPPTRPAHHPSTSRTTTA